jgi:hypothetical protein
MCYYLQMYMYQYFTTMKTVQQKLRWPGVISVALLALMFTSCSKHDDDNNVQVSTSSLAVIDVSSTAPALDFYLDGAVVNASPINYGGGLIYFAVYSGTRHVAFNQTGSATVIAKDTATLKPGAAYTMVLSNLPTNPDVTLFRDSVYMPPTSDAAIRLINASPDAGNVDFALKGESLLGSNVAYRKATPFVPVAVSSQSDTVMIYKTGTNTVVQKVPITLQTGGVFTVYMYGFAAQSSASEKLTAGVLENAFY